MLKQTIAITLISATVALASAPSRQQAFFDRYAAQVINASLQVKALLPSVALAQAALETGYGSSYLYRKGNNPYGIKWTKGCGYEKIYTKSEGYFRKYNDKQLSINDRYRLLSQTKRYAKVLKTTTPYEQAIAIRKAGYASSANYAQTINQIIKKYNLTKYDDKMYRMIDSLDMQSATIRSINVKHVNIPTSVNLTTLTIPVPDTLITQLTR